MSGTYCYVSNQISVYGDDKNIDNFMEHVADVGQGLIFSFERIRPMPPSEQQQIEETLGECHSFSPGEVEPGWWLWRQKFWGTRWDLLKDDPVEVKRFPGIVTYKFLTAWSPCDAAVRYLSTLFPHLKIEMVSTCSHCQTVVGYLHLAHQ